MLRIVARDRSTAVTRPDRAPEISVTVAFLTVPASGSHRAPALNLLVVWWPRPAAGVFV